MWAGTPMSGYVNAEQGLPRHKLLTAKWLIWLFNSIRQFLCIKGIVYFRDWNLAGRDVIRELRCELLFWDGSDPSDSVSRPMHGGSSNCSEV